MADWLLYEHDDGRRAVAPSAEAATFAKGDPAWHRVGPVEVPTTGLSRAAEIVQAEISRAETLLNVERGGKPLFDRAQTEAGIAALRTVAAAIEVERNAGVPASDSTEETPPLPPTPQPLYIHPKLGEMFDRFQLQQYAMRYRFDPQRVNAASGVKGPGHG